MNHQVIVIAYWLLHPSCLKVKPHGEQADSFVTSLADEFGQDETFAILRANSSAGGEM